MNKLISLSFFVIVATGLSHAQSFHRTRMIDATGHEIPVDLEFDKRTQSLSVKTLKAVVAEVPYGNIDKVSYEQASRHRVKEGAIVMIASFGAGGVVMLTKSKSHWLYVDYTPSGATAKQLIVKLDKTEYREVLNAAKEQTGRDVETLVPRNSTAKRQGT